MTTFASFLREREGSLTEQMDRPDCDPDRLRRSYARFPLVNFLVAAWGRNYTRRIRPLLSGSTPLTLLDLGCGGGELVRRLVRRAARDGLLLEATGADPDPRAHAFATSRPAHDGVTYLRADSTELLTGGRQYDVVVSNHVLHHLSAAELAAMLSDSERLARRLVLHNDLRRSRLAYLLFLAGFWPLGPGSYIHTDGLASIRRSYTQAELRAIVPPGWQVVRNGAWHLLLVYRPPGGGSA
ncbi:class I SAM-dependent methyltransferase [Arthrobacter cupressi]|uniref:Methyltransferase domain-containing protein n=1 Tax=Arthrobacter cupressi TaxID=1045773 RepID=A0A1G8WRH2_9MICC|nr:class I SAM-dependent methyltransferase [Arthrobacter cupressi]NYD79880.1 2-polyprenyl-3-methyl-5-hydroxy-6-metoxy-1,4-benzoquinol methylase [Arthrobacter cupressi]SDJ80979.1 Methyltransferase domain-containing protein [Arthrobacter cupressi]